MSSTTVATARPAISESELSSATQPVVPSLLENARPMPLRKSSIWLGSSPTAWCLAAADGPYQGRPSEAMMPTAAAIANRMLLRNPIVRMCCTYRHPRSRH